MKKQQYFIYNHVVPTWRPKKGRILDIYTGISSNLANSYSTNVGTSSCTTSTLRYNHIKLASSKFTPFSELWCKEKKAEILKLGPLAIFEDMSKIKSYDYFATTNLGQKPFTYFSLKNKAGIYMITNNITKKYYIGMSRDLKSRIYNYLCTKRLTENKSSRIHKALLKYGFSNFSFSILEFVDSNNTVLNRREDLFIRIFKPQYNIARSFFNIDFKKDENSRSFKLRLIIPLKIKNLLDKTLDPFFLDWHLVSFQFNKTKNFYLFTWITPKSIIYANSLGWFEGYITKDIGYQVKNIKKEKKVMDIKTILDSYKLIDTERLAYFYPDKKADFVKNKFKDKAKALKKL